MRVLYLLLLSLIIQDSMGGFSAKSKNIQTPTLYLQIRNRNAVSIRYHQKGAKWLGVNAYDMQPYKADLINRLRSTKDRIINHENTLKSRFFKQNRIWNFNPIEFNIFVFKKWDFNVFS